MSFRVFGLVGGKGDLELFSILVFSFRVSEYLDLLEGEEVFEVI